MSGLRYQLGAEELIELGADGSKVILKNRKPFLAGRIVKLGNKSLRRDTIHTMLFHPLKMRCHHMWVLRRK